ncbi:hypothetical protein OAF34_05255 [Pirellulaceae bacterium]|nr:hypothetical protein [Pirellulaceae bacterium]
MINIHQKLGASTAKLNFSQPIVFAEISISLTLSEVCPWIEPFAQSATVPNNNIIFILKMTIGY